MGSALDSSLEDLIKARKEGGRGGRGRAGRGPGTTRNGYGDSLLGSYGDSFFGSSAFGPIRRDPFLPTFRPSPYLAVERDVDGPWKHDLYEAETSIVRTSGIETGTQVYISNLDYGVSDEDIKELFSEVGHMKWSSVRYDRSGRSEGCAEVLYSRRVDAEAAVKRYQDVVLDGKPMQVQIKGTNLARPIEHGKGLNASSLLGGGERRVIGNMFQGFGVAGVMQSDQVMRASGHFTPNRGPDKRGKVLEQKLRSDLDADLDRYLAKAKGKV